jgi:hypothetical protein
MVTANEPRGPGLFEQVLGARPESEPYGGKSMKNFFMTRLRRRAAWRKV